MMNVEYGAVDPTTARSINDIEDAYVVCEVCGLRKGHIVKVWFFNGRPSVIAHLECINNEDREGKGQG